MPHQEIIKKALIQQLQRIAAAEKVDLPSDAFDVEINDENRLRAVIGDFNIAVAPKEAMPLYSNMGWAMDGIWYEFEQRIKARASADVGTFHNAAQDYIGIKGSEVILPGHTVGVFGYTWKETIAALNFGLDDDLKITNEQVAKDMDAWMNGEDYTAFVQGVLKRICNKGGLGRA